MTAAEFDQYIREGGKFAVVDGITAANDEEGYQELVAQFEELMTQASRYILDGLNNYRDSQISVPGMMSKLTVVNSSFINNKASGKGGAIYGSDVRIVADNGESRFPATPPAASLTPFMSRG